MIIFGISRWYTEWEWRNIKRTDTYLLQQPMKIMNEGGALETQWMPSTVRSLSSRQDPKHLVSHSYPEQLHRTSMKSLRIWIGSLNCIKAVSKRHDKRWKRAKSVLIGIIWRVFSHAPARHASFTIGRHRRCHRFGSRRMRGRIHLLPFRRWWWWGCAARRRWASKPWIRWTSKDAGFRRLRCTGQIHSRSIMRSLGRGSGWTSFRVVPIIVTDGLKEISSQWIEDSPWLIVVLGWPWTDLPWSTHFRCWFEPIVNGSTGHLRGLSENCWR